MGTESNAGVKSQAVYHQDRARWGSTDQLSLDHSESLWSPLNTVVTRLTQHCVTQCAVVLGHCGVLLP